MTVVLPPMLAAQRDAWHALMDVHGRMPKGWVLVGGQMVHLHCAERGVVPSRPTDDVDAVVDVRADSRALRRFTAVLRELGFAPAGTSWEGHQHRWVRGDAVIDVLIPRGVSERSPARRTVTGGTTIETPGAQQPVDRAQAVDVVVEGRPGTVRRPSLLGAIVAKAAGVAIPVDPDRVRHQHDFVVLTTLIRPDDEIHSATKRDREHIATMLRALAREQSWKSITGGPEGVERLRLALEPEATPTRRRDAPWSR